MPSPFESLSMVLLAAWNHGLPALVNARCKVLRGQVERANGGLYYANTTELSAAPARRARTHGVARAARASSANIAGRLSWTRSSGCCRRPDSACRRKRHDEG